MGVTGGRHGTLLLKCVLIFLRHATVRGEAGEGSGTGGGLSPSVVGARGG